MIANMHALMKVANHIDGMNCVGSSDSTFWLELQLCSGAVIELVTACVLLLPILETCPCLERLLVNFFYKSEIYAV